jgi:GxxExxY protein
MARYEPIPESVEEAAAQLVDAAFTVHTTLGPGLLESVYEACLRYELEKRGLNVRTQVYLPIVYDDRELESGLRLDMLVEESIIVEIKAAEVMLPLFEAQLLTYLKLAEKRLGFLINFNVPALKNGIKRMVL